MEHRPMFLVAKIDGEWIVFEMLEEKILFQGGFLDAWTQARAHAQAHAPALVAAVNDSGDFVARERIETPGPTPEAGPYRAAKVPPRWRRTSWRDMAARENGVRESVDRVATAHASDAPSAAEVARTAADPKDRLVDLLDRKVFRPVLEASPDRYPEPQREALEQLRAAAERTFERYRTGCASAQELYDQYRSDLASDPARSVWRELKQLGLPTLEDVEQEVRSLARDTPER